jgi:quinol monooxygenase YgiN
MNNGHVYEIAQLHIRPESRETFKRSAIKAVEVLRKVTGCEGATVLFGIEEPDRPRLMVRWTSVEAHETFRQTPAFSEYRATIQDTFASPPSYGHYVAVVEEPGCASRAPTR